MERRRKIVDENVVIATRVDTKVCNRLDEAALKLRMTRGALIAFVIESFVESPDCVKCFLDAKKDIGERLIRYRE